MQKNYYAIIPANVRYDEKLIPSAKLLYGEIAALCDENGECWLNNQYFADLYDVNKISISHWIKNLVNRGYITFSQDENIVSKLKSKKMDGFGYGSQECSWCQVKTSVLHKHHYPIPKMSGGTDTVDICPNCHHEFHYHQNKIKLTLTDAELKMLLAVRGEINESCI